MKKEIEEAKRCLSKEKNVCERCERLSTLCRGNRELADFILEMVADD